MDSLLANYASSDDEGEAEEVSRPISTSKLSSLSTNLPPPKSSSFFSSLPPPRIATSSSPSSSSPLFSSIPPPKSQFPNHSLDDYKREDDGGKPYRKLPSSSIFSSLPPPKTSSSATYSSLPAPKSQSGNPSNKPSLDQNARKVVPFTIPLNPSMLKSHDPDEEEDEEMIRKVRKDAPPLSAPKALSSMLPAPKNSICLAPAQSMGVLRRSSLQTDALPLNFQQESKAEKEEGSFANYSTYRAEQGVVTGYEIYG
ncbi:flocculation protein FLO11-like, partial [Phalaenopsis equestris]